MSDTAPALTDEQIDAHLHELREAFYLNGEWTDPNVYFDSTIAAVIARAKREERGRIATAVASLLVGDKHGCLRHGVDCSACRALDRAINYVQIATGGDSRVR